MNERESIECMNVEMRKIELLYEMLMEEKIRPSVIYKPKVSIDGNQYNVLYGENLMEGVEGFGDSVAEAMADFDKNWFKKDLKSTKEIKEEKKDEGENKSE